MQKSDLPKSLRNLNKSRKTPDRNLDRVLEAMRSADRSCHKMMAIEVWAIAKTVDNIFPGFWNRFMLNRQLALKQFLEMKQAKRSANSTSSENSDVDDDLTSSGLIDDDLNDLVELENFLLGGVDGSVSDDDDIDEESSI